MADYEKPGSFYLGRPFDLASGELAHEKVLYDANDLTTHAVCVGMTGSGKTGLCMSLLEEAALDGIPIIAVDPKGDLGNLLLAFPELRPSDFEPWVDPSVAQQQGITKEQLAEQTASLWKKGLADWEEDQARVQRYADVDKAIYTPGSTAGMPLTVLKGFHAPPQAVIEDGDTYNDLLQSTTQCVLALVGIDADPVQSREAILISNLLDHAWRAGRSLNLSALIHDIQKPPFLKVGIVDIENFLPAKDRMALGMKINNLLASPSFANWLQGESLDIESLLYTADKKPRLSILSIAHLNDNERMFFVTILLNEILSWMRSQSGTGSLRAILYMDEVFGYFPPSANPPSKRPMLTLLKQARAFGLGVVLATQNPVDLDYKGLSNAGTWFLGRLQTERDKLRVLDGLEGASAQAGSKFNRGEMDAMLSGLRSRVFLVNNVHSDQPQVMHTRWVMSYLRGPLTRDQIRVLMQDRKPNAAESLAAEKKPTERLTVSHDQARPMLSGNISEKFWPLSRVPDSESTVQYQPALVAEIELTSLLQAKFLVRREMNSELPSSIWEGAQILTPPNDWDNEPYSKSGFLSLVGPLTQDKNYKIWQRDLGEWFEKQYRSLRDLTTKRDKLEDSVRKVQLEVDENRWWWLGSLWRALEVIFVRLLGGSTRKQIVTQTSTKQMTRGRRRYSEAKAELTELTKEFAECQKDCDDFRAALGTRLSADPEVWDSLLTAIEKNQVEVSRVSLAWMPRQVDAQGQTQALY
jgi:hypothetical protein